MNKNTNIRYILSAIIISTGILVVTACCLFQFFHYHNLKKISLSDYEVLTDVEYDINSIQSKNTRYDSIQGWVASKENPPKYFQTSLVLYTDNSDIAYSIPLKLETRTDVTTHFNNENNYDNSGFTGMIAHKYIRK